MKAGWVKTTVGEAFSTATGGTPPKGNVALYGDFLPLVKPPELCDAELDAAADGLSEAGAKIARIAPPNSILVSCIGNLGKIGLNIVPVAFNQQINAILPNADKALPWFIFYQTLSCFFRDQLESFASGTTVSIVNKSKFNSVKIVLPPLPEQHRIVAILDEAFDGIATAKANAEKNLQNARALFERHLQSVFTERGEGWAEARLGDVFDIGSSKRILESEWTSAGVPFFGGKEIVKLAKYGTALSNSYISEEKYREYASKYDMPQQGDILITARGTIGVGYIVQEGDKFYYKDGNIISMRAKTPTNPHFVLYAFRSTAIADQLGGLTGTTVKHLPIEKAKELALNMPGVHGQNIVVDRIREFESESQRLESICQQKLTALDDLKKSLLHQAFSGQL